MHKRIITLLSLLFIYSVQLNAQDYVATETSILKSVFVSYNENVSGNAIIVFEELAKSKSIKLTDVKIKLDFRLVITLLPLQTGNIISLQLNELSLEDNYLYKGFDIKSLIIPSQVEMKLEVKNEDENLVTELKTKSIRIQQNHTKKAVVNYNGFEKFTADDVNVIAFVFTYDDKATNRFKQKTELINDYLNFSSLLQLEENKIKEIDIQNINKLVEYRDVLEENKKFIKKVENKNFNAKLNLTNNDPAAFNRSLSDLKDLSNKLSKEVDFALANMHITYYKKGISFLEQNDTNNARKYFYKSIDEKDKYAPPHIQLADFYKDTEQKDSSIYIILNVIKTMNPSLTQKEKCIEISAWVANDFQKIAEKNNQLKNYKMALPYLNAITNICTKISESICNDSVYDLYTIAHTGIFDEIISNCNKSIDSKIFADAENLIDSAVKYKNLHNYYILSQSKVVPLITELYKTVIFTADSLYDADDFSEANQQYLIAERLCKKFVDIPCDNAIYDGLQMTNQGMYDAKVDSVILLYNQKKPDDAVNLINKLKIQVLKFRLVENAELIKYEKLIFYESYNILVKDAKKLIYNNKYVESLELLLESNLLQLKYGFDKYHEFDSIYYNSAKQVVINELKNGKRRAAENNIAEAKKYYSIANAMLEKYNIEKDDELKLAFEELKSVIFSQKCKTAQLDYDVQLNTATRFIDEKKYIDANNALMKAVRISDENSDCQILTKVAIDKRDGILSIVSFQKKMLHINELIEAESYQDAILKYEKLQVFYDDSSIIKESGITLKPIKEFILNGKNDFINYAVKHYASGNKLEIALEYLNKLYENEYPAKWTEINQNLLGTKLAIKDNKVEDIDDPKSFVLKYFGNEKWFKNLEKAYLKQMKELKY